MICPKVLYDFLKLIKASENHADRFTGHLQFSCFEKIQHILHVVGELRHGGIAHGRRHALQCMGRTEDLIDDARAFRILFQYQKIFIKTLKVLICFLKKQIPVLLCIIHELVVPPYTFSYKKVESFLNPKLAGL